MLGEDVGHFMPYDHGQIRFGLGDGQETGVDDDFAPGHGPGIDVVAVDQVEFPMVAPQFGLNVFHPAVFGDGLSDPPADAFDPFRLLGVGARLVFLQEGLIVLQTHGAHHGIGHEVQLAASGDGDFATGAEAADGHAKGPEGDAVLIHGFILMRAEVSGLQVDRRRSCQKRDHTVSGTGGSRIA